MTNSDRLNFSLCKNENKIPAFDEGTCVILTKTYNDDYYYYTKYLTENRAFRIIECSLLPCYYDNTGKVVKTPDDGKEWCLLEYFGPDIPVDCEEGFVQPEDLYKTNESECLKSF